MSITSGFKKTKKYRKLSDGNYQLQSEWTSASTVEMDNGNTVETEMTTHDTQNNVATFTSDDSTTSLSSVPPDLITSGETHKSLFNKISTAVKNVRWLLSKIGTTDISAIGDGTVTNAISTLNSNIDTLFPLASVSASDPGAFKSGNWRGWLNSNGAQSAWFQIDCIAFQIQIRIENGTNKLLVRIKYNQSNSWDNIQWVEK